MFTLHPQLVSDTVPVSELALCRVLLMNNRHFPWLILVPRVKSAREIIDLSDEERHTLMDEISHVSQAMQGLFAPDKLNVAALGNQVEQLHIHIIARMKTDAAWPNPTFGKASEPYPDPGPVIEKIKAQLGPSRFPT